MAITPKEADVITAHENDAINQAEDKIDQQLRERYRPGEKCYCDLPSLGFTSRMRAELKRRYEAAGWQVAFESHQIDGNAIVLSAQS